MILQAAIVPYVKAIGVIAISILGTRMAIESVQALAGKKVHYLYKMLRKDKFISPFLGALSGLIVPDTFALSMTASGIIGAKLITIQQAFLFYLGFVPASLCFVLFLDLAPVNFSYLFLALGILPHIMFRNFNFRQTGKLLVGLGLLFFSFQLLQQHIESGFTVSIQTFFASVQAWRIFLFILTMLLSFIVKRSIFLIPLFVAAYNAQALTILDVVLAFIGMKLGESFALTFSLRLASNKARFFVFRNFIINLMTALPLILLYEHAASILEYFGIPPFELWPLSLFLTLFVWSVIFSLLARLFRPIVDLIFIGDDGPSFVQEFRLITGQKSELLLPFTSLVLAWQGLSHFSLLVEQIFKLTSKYLISKEKSASQLALIKNKENATDFIREELRGFVERMLELEVDPSHSREAQTIVRVASEFEIVADYLDRMATIKTEHFKKICRPRFDKLIIDLFAETEDFFKNVVEALSREVSVDDVEALGLKLKEHIRNVRQVLLDHKCSGVNTTAELIAYWELFTSLRRIRSHTLNILGALCAVKRIR